MDDEDMAKFPWLERRRGSGRWYMRVPVPTDLVPLAGQKFKRPSLKTSDAIAARKAYPQALRGIEEYFDELRCQLAGLDRVDRARTTGELDALRRIDIEALVLGWWKRREEGREGDEHLLAQTQAEFDDLHEMDRHLTDEDVARLVDRLLVEAGVTSAPLNFGPIKTHVQYPRVDRTSKTYRELLELVGRGFQSATGDWVPLYVGRMIHQFDHRAASVVVNEENVHNAALSGEVTVEMKLDPGFLPEPQFWVPASATALVNGNDYVISFRDIARATDARTFIAAIAPAVGFGNKAPLIIGREDKLTAADTALLTANLNAMCFDFVVRSKVQSTSVNWFIVEQLPVVPPDSYARIFGQKSAATIVGEAVLELTYTAYDMAAFARDMGHVDANGTVLPPFPWNEDRRLKLRAKLDALFFILYGIWDATDPAKSRDDISYIYSTFPIVERDEHAAYGRYRSRDLCLAWINALMAGQPDAAVQE